MKTTTMISSVMATALLLAGTVQAAPAKRSNKGHANAVHQVAPSRGQQVRVHTTTTPQRSVVAVQTTRHAQPRTAQRTVVETYRSPAPRVVVYNRAVPRRTVMVSTSVAHRRSPLVANRRPVPESYAAFRRSDRNHDGRINRAEARRTGRSVREFRRADTNGDGLLTRYEARFWF